MFHTYSCYSRGVDMLNGAYHHYLDLGPKGRDEAGFKFSMVSLSSQCRFTKCSRISARLEVA